MLCIKFPVESRDGFVGIIESILREKEPSVLNHPTLKAQVFAQIPNVCERKLSYHHFFFSSKLDI